MGEEFVKQAEARTKNFAINYLLKISNTLRRLFVNVETVTVHGIAADVILDYAKKENIDLIIMSTHGRAGVAKWALGSVADRVIRHSPVPLFLVVPKACRIS